MIDARSLSGLLLVTLDQAGRITSWNAACEEATQLSAGEACGRLFAEMIAATGVPPRPEEAEIGGPAPQRFEAALPARAGELRWIAWAATPQLSADGQVEGTILAGLDIADRGTRPLPAELDAERRWLKAVIATVPVAVLLFDAKGRLTFNERAEELLGMTLSADGGSAQYRSRILHRDGAPVPREQLASYRVLAHGEIILGEEYLVEREDGSRIAILGSAAPIRGSQGEILGGVGVFQDVSAQARAREDLQASERLLSGIFELLPVGVWIADSAGRIVRTNPAGQRIWGGARYVGVEAFGEYRAWWADSGEPVAPADWALARALRRGETSLGELLRIQCFDGTFKTILNSALPLYDERGHFSGAVVVNEDVTLLKEIEDDLRRAVRARDEVLSIVSHDLRNPLAGIELAAQMVSRQMAALVGPEDRSRRVFAHILQATERMRRLIGDLLDFASIQEGRLAIKRSHLDPAALLDEITDTFHPQAEQLEIELSAAAEPDLPGVEADRGRMIQALSNLVGNALKFTPRGGRVWIEAAAGHGEVLFRVADSGPGIREEERAHLFERFWKADASDQRGHGLGLAITRAIVEAHGGRIWVDSEVGCGSTFSVALPSALPRGEQPQRGASPAPPPD